MTTVFSPSAGFTFTTHTGRSLHLERDLRTILLYCTILALINVIIINYSDKFLYYTFRFNDFMKVIRYVQYMAGSFEMLINQSIYLSVLQCPC